jgi:hypothetical protein
MTAIQARTPTVSPRSAFPLIVRPRGAPKASTPAAVPEPMHHHLPAWVRRAHSQAQPILADLIGSLDGEPRQELNDAVDALTGLISSGKFSQAWRYPDLIKTGQRLYDRQSKEKLEAQREQRALEGNRRKAAELLRDSGVALPPDVAARLSRELRSAADHAGINEVSTHIREAIASARTVQEKRREREIDRTRAQIQRAPARETTSDANDSWQDVLFRLKQQMSKEEAEETAAPES